MGFQVGFIGILITLIARTPFHKVQGALNRAIEIGLIELTALHTCHDRVELLGLTRLEHVITCPHLLGSILTTVPVGHDRSLKAPLIAEDGSDEILALGSIDTIDVVIRSHHRPGLTLLDSYLKAFQVDLAQGTLRDTCIVAHTVGFLTVGCEVFDACSYIILLYTQDIGSGGLTCHYGIF